MDSITLRGAGKDDEAECDLENADDQDNGAMAAHDVR